MAPCVVDNVWVDQLRDLEGSRRPDDVLTFCWYCASQLKIGLWFFSQECLSNWTLSVVEPRSCVASSNNLWHGFSRVAAIEDCNTVISKLHHLLDFWKLCLPWSWFVRNFSSPDLSSHKWLLCQRQLGDQLRAWRRGTRHGSGGWPHRRQPFGRLPLFLPLTHLPLPSEREPQLWWTSWGVMSTTWLYSFGCLSYRLKHGGLLQ